MKDHDSDFVFQEQCSCLSKFRLPILNLTFVKTLSPLGFLLFQNKLPYLRVLCLNLVNKKNKNKKNSMFEYFVYIVDI